MESNYAFGIVLCLLVLGIVTLVALIGGSVVSAEYNIIAEECAKQHNVHACEIVAIPIEANK